MRLRGTPTPTLATQERIAREVAPFREWLKTVTPTFKWDWPYLSYIQQHLKSITEGRLKRLMIFLPPRHGKSEMVTVRYPVWRLEREPELRVIVGAYNQDFATGFSRKSKRIAQKRFALSADRATASDWETAHAGGLRAVGVGSGVTGRGGDLIIIDDPVKSREEANSASYRQRVWDWFTDDLYTRLEPGGALVLIMTRWHEDDLAGRILASNFADDWTVISLPAFAEADDPLGRAQGAALCPERFSVLDLQGIQRVMGNSFYALYQQKPQPPSGKFFKRVWFDVLPAAPAPGRCYWVRYWDLANSTTGNPTAGVLMALTKDTGEYVVVDVEIGKWEDDERDKRIRQVATDDAARYPGIQTWREREGGSSGKDSARAFIKMLAGHAAYAEYMPGKGSKITRAEPLQAQAMIGNVKLVAGAWNKPYLDELTAFPFGTNDDQVDGSTGAFRRLNVQAAMERQNTQPTEAPAAGGRRYDQNTMRGRM